MSMSINPYREFVERPHDWATTDMFASPTTPAFAPPVLPIEITPKLETKTLAIPPPIFRDTQNVLSSLIRPEFGAQLMPLLIGACVGVLGLLAAQKAHKVLIKK